MTNQNFFFVMDSNGKVIVSFSIIGYIIHIDGPHMGANGDSQITKEMISKAQTQAESVFKWMRDNDLFIVDRGFYDCLDILRDMGFKVIICCFFIIYNQYDLKKRPETTEIKMLLIS